MSSVGSHTEDSESSDSDQSENVLTTPPTPISAASLDQLGSGLDALCIASDDSPDRSPAEPADKPMDDVELGGDPFGCSAFDPDCQMANSSCHESDSELAILGALPDLLSGDLFDDPTETLTTRLCSSDDDRVPDQVLKAYRNSNILALEGIGEALSVSNYRQKFQNLLWWDELKETEERERCNEKNVIVRPESDEERAKRREGSEQDELLDDPAQYKLKLEGNSPNLKSMSELELKSKQCLEIYRGTVVKIQEKFVYFTLYEDKLKSARLVKPEFNCDYLYDVAFSINRISLSRCHAALNEFSTSYALKIALFPSAEKDLSMPLIDASDLHTSTGPKYLLGRTLNDSQKAAVVGILESTCRPAPYIVFGPPGTGKTATLVETILQVHKRKPHFKILVCGTSNDSTDVLARALFKSEAIEPHEFVRLSAAYRMRREVPKDIKPITVDIGRLKKCWDEGVTYSIYVTTCSQSAVLKQLTFEYVFVDEVGSAKEPEALIPLTLVEPGGALVLAGDPKQLGPVCQSDEANLFGLGLSLLERLFKRDIYGGDRSLEGGKLDNNHITMLSVCYRSDQRLLCVNNKMFYGDRLTFVRETDPQLLIHMNTPSPLMFVKSSYGQHQKQLGGTSSYNDSEARKVIKLVEKLYSFGIQPEQIGIASPYRAQVVHLMKMFKNKRMRYCKIETMEKFQGDEREVMIISTVISSGRTSDFFRDSRRFNVATSRAKWMQILVGNPQVLEQDNCWREYIKQAAEITI